MNLWDSACIFCHEISNGAYGYANHNNNREIQAVWIAKPHITIALLLLLLLQDV